MSSTRHRIAPPLKFSIGVLFLCLATSLWTNNAHAASWCENCSITGLTVEPGTGPRVLVNLTVDMGGSCLGPRNQVWFDPTTTKGKTLLTLFQGAFLAGKRINVQGNGVCTSFFIAQYEEVNTLYVY